MPQQPRRQRANWGARAIMAAAVLTGGLIWSVGVCGGIYKWVDEDGRTHYTDVPPDRAVKQMDLPSGPDESARRGSQEEADRLLELDRRKQQIRQRARARKKSESLQRQKEAEERQRVCKQARNDLGSLKQQAPVFWTNDRGERIFVEDDERPERISELTRFVNQYCRR